MGTSMNMPAHANPLKPSECELSERTVPFPRDGQSRPRWSDWLQMKQRDGPFWLDLPL